jgi:transposase
MKRAEVLQEVRKMVFEEIYGIWQQSRLTQEEAARMLGVCERTFRRQVDRYEECGVEGLIDKRLSQASHRRAPVDEVLGLVEQYKRRHEGWNAKHFYAWYCRDGGKRSYTWVKCRLQDARLIAKAPGRGKHRKRRERSAWPGMMLHQDGSTHAWTPGVQWDLILTMDDATNEHYSLFFVEQEGTLSSFLGIKEVIEKRGLFSSLYTDRGSHYWLTPEAGGKVDKVNLTQFGRAMKLLSIEMIPAYSPEARGRCERMFGTHQGRLPKELTLAGIKDMEIANRYVREIYLPAFNAEFMQPAMEEGSAFVPYIGTGLDDILCEQHARTVGKDNCVSFEGLKLQIPADRHRFHYVKVTVRVHRYQDGTLAVFHGPRRLACYSPQGELKEMKAVEKRAMSTVGN